VGHFRIVNFGSSLLTAEFEASLLLQFPAAFGMKLVLECGPIATLPRLDMTTSTWLDLEELLKAGKVPGKLFVRTNAGPCCEKKKKKHFFRAGPDTCGMPPNRKYFSLLFSSSDGQITGTVLTVFFCFLTVGHWASPAG
jgi:hypothetical protein